MRLAQFANLYWKSLIPKCFATRLILVQAKDAVVWKRTNL